MDLQFILDKYHLQDIFSASLALGLTQETLQLIYDDYNNIYYKKYQLIAKKIVEMLYEDSPDGMRIIYARAKNPEHLIEKIIRKIGKEDKAAYRNICVNNYRKIITDLIGIRILVLKKEDWEIADEHVHNKFKKFVQPPVAYVCYGDRDIFDESKIRTDYTNKGYRSQHYIVDYNDIPCEIQVRTLAEEVYGEFDHNIRYPYRTNNTFLTRYNQIISKVTSELDDLISTCSALSNEKLDELDNTFIDDTYVDWAKKIEGQASYLEHEEKISSPADKKTATSVLQFATRRLLQRKE